MVSDQEIANSVENLLQSDPNAFTSLTNVVQLLGRKLGLDLSHKAGFIRDQIQLLLRYSRQQQEQQQQQQQQQQPPGQVHPSPPKDHFALQHHHHHHHQQQQQHPQFQSNQHSQIPPHFALQQRQQQLHHEELNFHSPVQEHPNPQPLPSQPQPQSRSHPKKKAEPKEGAPAKRRGGPGGLNKVCGVSPELQAIVGEPRMPRTEIVKQLWAYIRKNNLQDPSNKRKIICNDELRLVFETDCTDMFKMNKLLAKHIIPLEPSKESGRDKKRAKIEVESTSESIEPPSPSLVIISDALAKFFDSGDREMPHSEALRRVWEYIQVNHLEDPMDSMVIACDPKLQELFGCENISALGVTEMVGRHLYKQS